MQYVDSHQILDPAEANWLKLKIRQVVFNHILRIPTCLSASAWLILKIPLGIILLYFYIQEFKVNKRKDPIKYVPETQLIGKIYK